MNPIAAATAPAARNNPPAKRRGRPVKQFVAKPAPVQQITALFEQHQVLSYEQLLKLTNLSEGVIGQALAALVVNSKRVRTFTRNDCRFYCLNQPKN